ncbi:PucR family transcriptional regulator [Paenibacillus hamazuiensis]|uniref:PucR family transcriptional regulator n=1 Tax=Paenibacillus hamazuiensis TaxID=2936508 RepID=UPI00200E15E7|nr:PucR family transcriptional regulator [Paenibacillus hamazuiensis]
MHLSVEQALTIYPFSEGKLIAGRSGVSRVVKSVNVMDAPDISDWVKDGEMLFTTAYVIKDSLNDAIYLLRKLDRRGSAGLGIKLGRFWEAVPEPMLEEADRLGFPLIELPYQFTFSDQMNGLFQAEFKRNTLELQSVLDKQKRLMRFALQSGRISQLFDAVSDIVGYPMAVVGSRGHLIYNATDYSPEELLRGWPWKNKFHPALIEGRRHYRVQLLQKEESLGYVLFFPPDIYVEKVEEGLFLQAAEMISYHMGYQYNPYMLKSAWQDLGAMMARYLKNELSIEALVEYADRLELGQWKKGFHCVLTQMPASLRHDEKNDWMKGIWEELQHHPALKLFDGFHVWLEDGLISIYPAEGPGDAETLQGMLTKCLGPLLQHDRVPCPRIAISSVKFRPDLLKEAHRECLEAVQLAQGLGMTERVVRFDGMELASVFRHVPKDKMQSYCRQVLAPLLEKDPEYFKEMIRTLETFIENDGQMAETAKRLYIHRNTATYRMEKLSELLQVDLKKFNDLFRLKLAILFRRMLDQE